MNPKVAIIITNYNYGKYIIAAVDSILSQTYRGEIRVYVVDDGSSDNSWDLLSEVTDPVESLAHTDRPYYSGPMDVRQRNTIYAYKINNSGASTGRNVALHEAWEWADIFGILDSDDAYYPEKVEKLVEKLMEYPEVGVAYADYENVNPMFSKREFKTSYSAQTLMRRCIVHSNSLIKKEYLEQVILPNGEIFDSRLHGPGSQAFIGCTEDYDLWIRLSKVCVMTHVPECLAIANITGQNQSSKMTAEIFNEHAKILGSR
jgi:glycosyltransferase involved in cell wall biosynthesis